MRVRAKHPAGAGPGAWATATATPRPPPTTLTLSTDATNDTAAEDAGTVTVTATLDNPAQGTDGVEVTLTAADASTATATDDYTLPAAFTIAEGETSATADVTIVDDDVDEDNETVVLSATAGTLTVRGVTLTITDDDTAGVTLSDSSLTVTEGETATYTLVLDSKPTANVTVTPATDDSEATVSAAVEFTPSNWNDAKTVTVTGVTAGSATISHTASSTDADYTSSLSIGSVSVTVEAADTTAPTVEFAPANGDTVKDADTNIVLTFSEAIRKDASDTELANADLSSILTLKTTDDSGTAILYAATINDAKTAITINPSSSLAEGAVYVAVSDEYYDEAGNQGAMATATFTVDTTAPTVSSAAVDGASLTIAFDENLAAAANLANSAFEVKKTPASGSEQTVTLSGSPSISGDTVTLTLATAAVHGDTDVKVSYTKPASGSDNTLEDAAGNEVASFTDQAVTNNTKSSDATLMSLAGSTSTDGSDFSGTLDLSAFASDTTAYTVIVADNVTHVKLTPTVSDSNASVKVGKQGHDARVGDQRYGERGHRAGRGRQRHRGGSHRRRRAARRPTP